MKPSAHYAVFDLDSTFKSHINSSIVGIEDNTLVGQKLSDIIGYETWDWIVSCLFQRGSMTLQTEELHRTGRFLLTCQWLFHKESLIITSEIIGVKRLSADHQDHNIRSESVFCQWIDANKPPKGVAVDIINNELNIILEKENDNTLTYSQQVFKQSETLLSTDEPLSRVLGLDRISVRGTSIRESIDRSAFNTKQYKRKRRMLKQQRVLSNLIQTNPYFPLSYGDECNVIIMSSSKDDGYKYLYVNPAQDDERRLNKPIDDLVGKPVDTIDYNLYQSRIKAIEKCLSSGFAEYEYTHYWKGYDFLFECKMMLLKPFNELVLISRYPDTVREKQNEVFKVLAVQ